MIEKCSKLKVSVVPDQKGCFISEQIILSTTHRAEDGLLKDVNTACLQGDADGLLVQLLLKAALKHPIHDLLQPGINHLLVVSVIMVEDSLLGVRVNALGCKVKKNILVLVR